MTPRNIFLISNAIDPTDLLHPSPAPHFKNFELLQWLHLQAAYLTF